MRDTTSSVADAKSSASSCDALRSEPLTPLIIERVTFVDPHLGELEEITLTPHEFVRETHEEAALRVSRESAFPAVPVRAAEEAHGR